jgi:tRNA nucleotidyltransferase (CCA-adding enzyme)
LYLVGGAVRDRLLGLFSSDTDWVAVGYTAQDLLARGFKPVGRDFPVFLHPQTRDEVALARTERKTAPGYHGFTFHADSSVTLEQDLQRRDLTINAMAMDDSGHVIDPWGGQQDLQNKILRHVSGAFTEDPVRILRLARFAARWPHFSVAHETMALCSAMVQAGEVDALVPERVWQELSKGLMEPDPARMLEVLRACGALRRLLPEVDRLWGVPQRVEYHPEVDTGVHLLIVLRMAAQKKAPLSVRYACLVHDLGKGTTPQSEWPRHIGHEQRSVLLAREIGRRLRVPTDCKELAEIVAREHGHIHRSLDMSAEAITRLLGRCDAWRRPDRFKEVLQACEADARGRLGFEDKPYVVSDRLCAMVQAVLKAIPVALAARGRQPQIVGEEMGRFIYDARVSTVKGFLGGDLSGQ